METEDLSYTIYYFDKNPGRAEPIRVLFYYKNITFNEIRFSFPTDPPKSNSPLYPTWQHFKESGKIPYKMLPVLEVTFPDTSSKLYTQSKAILAYLGHKYQCIPTTPEESYQMWNIIFALDDLVEKMLKAYLEEPDPQKQTSLKNDYFQILLPQYFQEFQNILVENGNPNFLVGNSYSIADFYFLGVLTRTTLYRSDFFDGDKYLEVLSKFPDLEKYVKKTDDEFPKFKNYLNFDEEIKE